MSNKSTNSAQVAIPRYAVYFAPSDQSELGEFGRHVLQRNTVIHDHPIRVAVTEKASHYGFHSTFKAPMELADGVKEADFLSAVERFVKTRKKIALTGIAPNVVSQFHALTLPQSPESAQSLDVDQLAADVMHAFESYRAPLTDYDKQRRNPEKLSERQRQYLETYGYAQVLEEFNFHMTLSNRITDAVKSDSYHRWLKVQFAAAVTTTPWLEQLAVFWQPDRATAFTRIAEFPVK